MKIKISIANPSGAPDFDKKINIILLYVLCGHCALGTVSETCVKVAVFELENSFPEEYMMFEFIDIPAWSFVLELVLGSLVLD